MFGGSGSRVLGFKVFGFWGFRVWGFGFRVCVRSGVYCVAFEF